MTTVSVATAKDLHPAPIDQVAMFMIFVLPMVLRILWTQRNNPNSRRGHEARHTPAAVGLRDGRSVGQILRRLNQEQGTT